MPISSIACFQAFAEQLIGQREKITAAWLLVHAAELQQTTALWRDADQIYERVLNDFDGLGDRAVVNILLSRGSFLLRHGENVKAAKYLEQALQLSRSFGNDNVATLGTLRKPHQFLLVQR